MRTTLAASIIPFLLIMVPLGEGASGREGVGSDTAWQHPGETWTFLGAQLPLGSIILDPQSPDHWTCDHARISDVTPTSMTLQFTSFAAPNLAVNSVTATYSRQTRLDQAGQGAYLWISSAEVAAGVALLGNHEYILLVTSPALVEFSDGQVDYWYDAHTGLLDHVTDEWSGAASTRSPAPAPCLTPADAED